MTRTSTAWLGAIVGIAAATVALGTGCRKPQQSGGEISRNWKPAEAPGIGGVPANAILTAIQQRLAAGAPSPINADQWRHAQQLYKNFPTGPLWLDEKGVQRPRATALLSAIANADSDGLRLDRYPVAAIEHALQAIDSDGASPTPDQFAEADVDLTAAYAALGENLLTGELRPAAFAQAWHIDPLEERVDSALALTLREDDLAAGVARMRPQNPGYDSLRLALARYRALAAKGGWTPVPAGRRLNRGDRESSSRLSALVQRLTEERLFMPDSADSTRELDTTTVAPLAVGTVFSKSMSAAVSEFQARHGIEPDGMVGKETVDAMNVPIAFRIGQIAANLERYRWLPRSLGDRYLLVNVPEFTLQAFDSGQKKLEMKVIVGAEYNDRATPVFSDSMQFVIFRPYWNVTDRIAANELWPKVASDPGFLERNNYEVVNEHGKQRIRQRPGGKNALGLVKFMFPNDYNIYLHDTPNNDLFAKDVRAFSHGCIRIERPADLAQFVLGWPPDRVRSEMNGRDDHTVYLPAKLPVYIVYFTTFVRDARLHFASDLYSRDDKLVGEMSTVAQPTPESIAAASTLRRLAGRN